jgi:outer membrane receptor for ferric coprogen and ferric-rhodotorulic acid
MKRLLFVLVALVLSAAAASADVTVTTSMSGAAGQTAISGTVTTLAKGTKLRADTEASGQSVTILSDETAVED